MKESAKRACLWACSKVPGNVEFWGEWGESDYSQNSFKSRYTRNAYGSYEYYSFKTHIDKDLANAIFNMQNSIIPNLEAKKRIY